MASLYRCERCSRAVPKSPLHIARKVVFFSLFATILPYASLLFVAGPGVVGAIPIVAALGLSIGSGLREWAFPRDLCRHCGASLEHAPRAPHRAAASAVVRRVAA